MALAVSSDIGDASRTLKLIGSQKGEIQNLGSARDQGKPNNDRGGILACFNLQLPFEE